MHKCDNPPCCKPSHLLLGTNADNVADKVAKGRQTSGESHYTAKMTDSDVGGIRHLLSTGLSTVEIGRALGIPRQTINDIKVGRTWRTKKT